MALDNASIMAAAYLHGTSDYQQRVPRVSQAGVARVAETLFAPGNGDLMNQFSNFLINRIGTQYIRQKAFKNPLGFLKNDTVPFGATIEETALKWVKGHSFNADDMATETVLKTHYPDGVSAFHSQNRQDIYETSFNPYANKRAFVQEAGLNDLLAASLESVYNADEYDTYTITKQLFAEYDRYHGMFKKKVEAVDDETTAKALLRTLREFADMLRFPSTLYNAQDVEGIPTFTNGAEELILFTTPRVKAALDVEALSALFHVEYAEIPYRVIVVDSFPMPDVEAILTVRDSFMISDTVYEMRNFSNPHSLTDNYYLHHWGIYSMSPFTPMLAFVTNEEVEVPVITQTVTGIEVDAPEEVYLNDMRSNRMLAVNLLGTIEGVEDVCLADVGVRPDTATFKVMKVEGPDGDIAFTESQIQIWDNGAIYVAAHGNSKLAKAVKAGGVTVTLEALATYINPSDELQEFTQEVTFEVKCKPEE